MGELTEPCVHCRNQKPLADLRKTPKGQFLCNACLEKILAARAERAKAKNDEHQAAINEALLKVGYFALDVLCFCVAPAYLFWLVLDHIAFFKYYSDEVAYCVFGILFGIVALVWRKNKKPTIRPPDENKT